MTHFVLIRTSMQSLPAIRAETTKELSNNGHNLYVNYTCTGSIDYPFQFFKTKPYNHFNYLPAHVLSSRIAHVCPVRVSTSQIWIEMTERVLKIILFQER
jgi:hypothetical protein